MNIPVPEKAETASGSEDTLLFFPHTSLSEENEIILGEIPGDPDDPVVKVWVCDGFAIPPSSAWDQTQEDFPESEYLEEPDDERLELAWLPKPVGVLRLPFGQMHISVATQEFARKVRGTPLILEVGEEEPEN